MRTPDEHTTEEHAHYELCQEIDDLRAKLKIARTALDFYTKHPVHWDKDEKGVLIEEGPSKVAIEALNKTNNCNVQTDPAETTGLQRRNIHWGQIATAYTDAQMHLGFDPEFNWRVFMRDRLGFSQPKEQDQHQIDPAVKK